MEQTKATAQASAAVLMRQEKQVKIYDQALQRKGVIDVYRSLIWTRKYKEAGTVELHAALTEKNLELLQKGNILTMTGSVESAFVISILAPTRGATLRIFHLFCSSQRTGLRFPVDHCLSAIHFSGTSSPAALPCSLPSLSSLLHLLS